MKEQVRVEQNRIGDLPRQDGGDPRTITDLLHELSSEASVLARQEVQLAKAEINEKLAVHTRNAVSLAIGGAILLGALLAFLTAMNHGLTALLAQFMDLEMAVWLAPLILAGILAAVGWSMVKKAKETMAREGLVPEKTVATLKEDKRWIATRVK